MSTSEELQRARELIARHDAEEREKAIKTGVTALGGTVPSSVVGLRLDLGCGPNPREGFEGVDCRQYDGKVRHIVDLTRIPWPWASNSVAEVHASHFIEHLDATERVNFANELYRILVPGGKCSIIVPHWSSCRAYGDMTHKWPPVCEFWFYYLKKEWRDANAPHNDQLYTCNFDAVWGYALHPDLLVRSQEAQQYAIAWHKEACQDMMATLTKL